MRRGKPIMYWDVKTVRPLPHFCLHVELENGQQGIFDVTPYLQKGMGQALHNVDYFNQVGILFGAITWPHEQDIAPETLLAGLRPLP